MILTKADLKSKKQELQAKPGKPEHDTDGAEKWLVLVCRYTELTEFNAHLFNKLIDKFVIHQVMNGENGSITQGIEIFYRFLVKINQTTLAVSLSLGKRRI